MASARLMKGIAKRNLKVRKLISGEVMIKFMNEKIKPIMVGHSLPIEIFQARENLSADDVRHSNLIDLEAHGHIEVI
jgi:hypothetical protein